MTDLEATRRFYVDLLGCVAGREAPRWLDLDLRGHQLSAHLVSERGDAGRNLVDGDGVPIPHFGLVLEWDEWQATAARLRAAGAPFELEPRLRFEGEVGEQATMFLRDPSGNAIELKSFKDPTRLFARG